MFCFTRFSDFIYADLLNTVEELKARGVNVLNKKSIEKMKEMEAKKNDERRND